MVSKKKQMGRRQFVCGLEDTTERTHAFALARHGTERETWGVGWRSLKASRGEAEPSCASPRLLLCRPPSTSLLV